MKNLLPLILIAALFHAPACTPKTGEKTAVTAPVLPAESSQWDTLGKPLLGEDAGSDEEAPVEYNFMEEAVVSPPADSLPDAIAPYNASHTFEHDLIHTKLELSFDWSKKHVLGKATLTLRPWFYATDKLTLDAKNFDIQSVAFEGKTEPLQYA